MLLVEDFGVLSVENSRKVVGKQYNWFLMLLKKTDFTLTLQCLGYSHRC